MTLGKPSLNVLRSAAWAFAAAQLVVAPALLMPSAAPRFATVARMFRLSHPMLAAESAVVMAIVVLATLLWRLDARRTSEAAAQGRKAATTDLLTGLANRYAMRQWLIQHGIVQSGGNSPINPPAFAYFLIDLDGFKSVNDVHGHAVGDKVLQAVAGRLRAVVSADAICSRINGDEFAIVIEGDGDAGRLGTTVVESLGQPFVIEGRDPIHIGASVGISLCPEHGTDTQKLFRCADRALYRVKRRGGGGMLVFAAADDLSAADEPEVQTSRIRQSERDQEDLRMERAFRGGLARNEFHVVFQPIARTEAGTVFAYEALVRWTSLSLGSVSPSTFIPVAERCGLILPLGAYVMRQACGLAATAGGTWSITVNVSAHQFGQPGIVTEVFDVLRDTGLPPSRLILELTEQSLLCDQDDVRARMRALRSAGIRLALDDFGSGFANVSYLKDFGFDFVKIDRAILLLPEHQRRPVLRALLDIARCFGAVSVVEGIETEADLELARVMDAALVQGFHLGRPQLGFVTVPQQGRSGARCATPTPGGEILPV